MWRPMCLHFTGNVRGAYFQRNLGYRNNCVVYSAYTLNHTPTLGKTGVKHCKLLSRGTIRLSVLARCLHRRRQNGKELLQSGTCPYLISARTRKEPRLHTDLAVVSSGARKAGATPPASTRLRGKETKKNARNVDQGSLLKKVASASFGKIQRPQKSRRRSSGFGVRGSRLRW